MRTATALAGAMVISGIMADAALAQGGDLAVRPEQLEKLVIGTGDYGFGLSVDSYRLTTGQAYQLEIESTGYHEYAMIGPEFFQSVWVRKVEVGDVEIKAHGFYEFEFEREGEMEIIFVPIRTGTFRLWARDMEPRGVVVTFEFE